MLGFENMTGSTLIAQKLNSYPGKANWEGENINNEWRTAVTARHSWREQREVGRSLSTNCNKTGIELARL